MGALFVQSLALSGRQRLRAWNRTGYRVSVDACGSQGEAAFGVFRIIEMGILFDILIVENKKANAVLALFASWDRGCRRIGSVIIHEAD
jgi:hypothetical protein